MGPAILCLQMVAPMSAMATIMSVICKDKMAASMSAILLNQTEVVVSLLVRMHECKWDFINVFQSLHFIGDDIFQ